MNTNSHKINGHLFTNGDYVQCNIHGTEVTDARIKIESSYIFYLLQNDVGGPVPKLICQDSWGYNNIWVFQLLLNGGTTDGVRNLRPGCNKPKDLV